MKKYSYFDRNFCKVFDRVAVITVGREVCWIPRLAAFFFDESHKRRFYPREGKLYTHPLSFARQVQSGEEEDEDMDEGGTEAQKGRSLRGEEGEEEGEEEDVDELSVQDVDAHWLQRLVIAQSES